MRATEFEFRHRFWFIGAIFWLAFLCYSFQHTSAAEVFGTWLAGGRDSHPLHAAEYTRGLLIFACVMTVAAAAIRIWGAAYLRSSVVHDIRLHAERLVADGPYRYTRNPLYFGSILLSVGIGLLAPPLGFVLLVILQALFHYRLALREETELSREQGESYRRYSESVPRLLPSLIPRVPSGNLEPHWKQGVLGEIFIAGLAAGTICFAITGKPTVLEWAVGLALATYFIARLLQRRARATSTDQSVS
jgi:protein-S-isoprenylcysteine O-methyltransferase Ste14